MSDPTYTLVLPGPYARAVMDALANNVTLQDNRARFVFDRHFIDDVGTARATEVYLEVSDQLHEQGWGTPVTAETRAALRGANE